MTNQQQIKLIKTKIQQIQSTLTLWTKNIATYHQQLQELTNQLNQIKKQYETNNQ